MSEVDGAHVAVVTGGTGALGRWIVRAFAARGRRVHVPVREQSPVDEVEAFLHEELRGRAPIRVTWTECDVTDPDRVTDFVDGMARGAGRIDTLVNGVGGFAMAPLTDTDPETWRRMMELNATSAFLCSRAAAPHLAGDEGGAIVNVASEPGLEGGGAGMSAYAASKSALVSLTDSLAEELRPRGITVNAVVPTVIDTPANREAMPDADTSTWLHPREIADVVTFLAGPEGRVVNGAAIRLGKE